MSRKQSTIKLARRNYMMPDHLHDLAAVVGNGNHSDGMRIMVRHYEAWLNCQKSGESKK